MLRDLTSLTVFFSHRINTAQVVLPYYTSHLLLSSSSSPLHIIGFDGMMNSLRQIGNDAGDPFEQNQLLSCRSSRVLPSSTSSSNPRHPLSSPHSLVPCCALMIGLLTVPRSLEFAHLRPRHLVPTSIAAEVGNGDCNSPPAAVLHSRWFMTRSRPSSPHLLSVFLSLIRIHIIP